MFFSTKLLLPHLVSFPTQTAIFHTLLINVMFSYTPLRINMEPKNHPTEDENHLPNLHLGFHGINIYIYTSSLDQLALLTSTLPEAAPDNWIPRYSPRRRSTLRSAAPGHLRRVSPGWERLVPGGRNGLVQPPTIVILFKGWNPTQCGDHNKFMT